MELSALLNKMFVFVALMLIGYFLARRGVIGQSFVSVGSRLAVDVFLVGTILGAMLSVQNSVTAEGLPIILLLTTLFQVISYAVAFLARKIVQPVPERAGAFELLAAVPNSVFIALPIVASLYGDYAVLVVSISCIPFNILLYSYGAWRVKRRDQGRFRIREVFNVPLVTTLIGIVLLVFRIPVPQAGRDLLAALGGATMPVSMLVIGASLKSVSLLDAFRNRQLALLSAVKLVLLPILIWLLFRPLTDNSVLLMTCVIIAASPGAVVASILAIQCGQDPVFSSEAVQHTTVCSVVTIPILIQILSRFC